MNNMKTFEGLKKGDKVKYEYWHDELKKGENNGTVTELHESQIGNDEVWVSDSRHDEGTIWEKTNDRIAEKTKDGETDYDIIIKSVDPSKKRIKQLEKETKLSEREAELYVLTEELGYTVQEAADEMDIKYGNASKKRSRIRDKIERAEKTAELEI